MDFKFAEKEEKLRDEVRKFAISEMRGKQVVSGMEEESRDEDWEFSMQMSKKLAQKGWLTMAWPREYGGRDASFFEQHVYINEASYWGIPGSTMGVSGIGWVGPSLMIFGNEEQRKKYIPPIAAGDPDGVWCTAYSEPNAGSDFANIQTRAIKNGDEYILNGQKIWTSCAHRARWCWLAVRTDPAVTKKQHGISLIILDMKSPGITINPIVNYAGIHIFNELFFEKFPPHMHCPIHPRSHFRQHHCHPRPTFVRLRSKRRCQEEDTPSGSSYRCPICEDTQQTHLACCLLHTLLWIIP